MTERVIAAIAYFARPPVVRRVRVHPNPAGQLNRLNGLLRPYHRRRPLLIRLPHLGGLVNGLRTSICVLHDEIHRRHHPADRASWVLLQAVCVRQNARRPRLSGQAVVRKWQRLAHQARHAGASALADERRRPAAAFRPVCLLYRRSGGGTVTGLVLAALSFSSPSLPGARQRGPPGGCHRERPTAIASRARRDGSSPVLPLRCSRPRAHRDRRHRP